MPLDLSAPAVAIVGWDDPVIDALGYPPRSTYVERFWLAILGPSATWLVRHVDELLSSDPDGARLDLDATAAALGLGSGRGRHSPLVRALHRCVQFGLARPLTDAQMSFRRTLPPLTRHQIERLPAPVRARHAEWRATERDAGVLDPQSRRARHMALGLIELGQDVATTEQRLVRLHIHPVVAHDAACWAERLVRHRGASVTPLPTPPPLADPGPISGRTPSPNDAA